jgi:hypothetical protein
VTQSQYLPFLARGRLQAGDLPEAQLVQVAAITTHTVSQPQLVMRQVAAADRVLDFKHYDR